MSGSGQRPRIAAVIKARNEAHQIGDCIGSLAGFADEVVVVDDGSDDATATLARKAGAVVIPARSQGGYINVMDRIGFEAASAEWLCRLDADERMTPDLAARLREVAEDPAVDGVRFARRNIMFGDWPRHGGWFIADQLRFFRRSSWVREDDRWERDLHAHPTIRGRVITLPPVGRLATVHLDYDDVPEFAHRSLERYARTEAALRTDEGVRPSPLRMLYLPVRRFLGRYVIRQGWRDGTRGLVLALLLAAYDLMIELNIWDLQRPGGTAERQ